MQHPLENPSLTPVGFTFSGGATRLQHGTSPGYINHDLVSAEFWSNANSLKASLPRPAETIIHELMPSIATIGRTTKGDFEFAGRPYLSRDIMILSRFVSGLVRTAVDHFCFTATIMSPKEHQPKKFSCLS